MNDHRDAEASRLTIDYRNAMADAVGPEHGVTDAMLDEIAPVIAEQHARLSAEHAAGGQRWMDLPSDTALAGKIKRSPPRPAPSTGISSWSVSAARRSGRLQRSRR